MIEITLQLEKEKVVELMLKRLKSQFELAGKELDLYEDYFSDHVEHWFPMNTPLDHFVDDIYLNSTSIIYPRDADYYDVKSLYDTEDFENNELVVVGKAGNLYLVEYL